MATRGEWRAAMLATVLTTTALGASACGSRTGLDELVDNAGRADGGLDGRARDAGLDAADATRRDGPKIFPGQALCADAGTTYIYVIGLDNELYSFYPATGDFTPVGFIDCPAPPGSTPFSMAVDHLGTAYVVFNSDTPGGPGDGALYKVSTKTAACEATPFVPNQLGIGTFGMGFVANAGNGDPNGTGETLFVAGDMVNALATIDLETFKLREVAAFQSNDGNMVSSAELTGTGDGRLFGFFAPTNAAPPSFIDQIDPQTAVVLSSVLLPDVTEGEGWAFGFWGGDFYTFTAPDGTTSVVTRYRPSDQSVTQVASAPFGVVIVGAGVSTCAPQQ